MENGFNHLRIRDTILNGTKKIPGDYRYLCENNKPIYAEIESTLGLNFCGILNLVHIYNFEGLAVNIKCYTGLFNIVIADTTEHLMLTLTVNIDTGEMIINVEAP